MYVNRNASSVVAFSDGIVLVYDYGYLVAVSCEMLVYGVIYNLLKNMMKSSFACVANVHCRTLPDAFKTFQDLDGVCSVVIPLCTVYFRSHANTLVNALQVKQLTGNKLTNN